MNRRRFIAGTGAVAVALSFHRGTRAEATPTATIWGSAAPLPVGRSEFAATVLDGKIYVAGGFGAESLFDRYDPSTNQWESLADLPAPRNHLGLAAVDGGVYVAGGHNHGTNSATDTFWRFDVAAGTWETLAPLPQGPRGGLGAAALNGSIYVAGGSSVDLSGPATGDVARYDPATATWAACAPMPTAREHLAVGVAAGKLVTVGGRNGGYEALELISATEVYEPATDSWTTGAALPVPRAGFGTANNGDSIIVIGGERFTDDDGAADARAYAAVNSYDVSLDQWSSLPDMPLARHGMAAAVVDGVLYAIGGSTVAGQVANVDRVDTLLLT
ncbi:MAG: Kelch repeat-containing protein [Thermomicrobiales bacterium]